VKTSDAEMTLIVQKTYTKVNFYNTQAEFISSRTDSGLCARQTSCQVQTA